MAVTFSPAISNHVRIDDYPAIRAQRPMSLFARIKRNAAGEIDHFFWKRTVNGGFGLFSPGGNGLTFTFFNVADVSASVGLGASTDWMALGVSISASGLLRFYLNGAQLGADRSIAAPANDVGGPLYIGARTNFDGNPDGGSDFTVADAAMWTAELSADDFAMLAKGYSPLFVAKPLSLYLPLVRDPINLAGPSAVFAGTVTIVDHPRVIPPWIGWTAGVGTGSAAAPSGSATLSARVVAAGIGRKNATGGSVLPFRVVASASGAKAAEGAAAARSSGSATAAGSSARTGASASRLSAGVAAAGASHRLGAALASIRVANAVSTEIVRSGSAVAAIRLAALAAGGSARAADAIAVLRAAAAASGASARAEEARAALRLAGLALGESARAGGAVMVGRVAVQVAGTSAKQIDIEAIAELEGVFDALVELDGVFDPVAQVAGVAR